MIYDGFGRRVGIIEQNGVSVISSKTFVWCGAGLCQERNSAGVSVTKEFFPLGEVISGIKHFYAKDHLGNVREVTAPGGTVEASYDYDVYGRQTRLSGTFDADFGYTGMYVNKTTGLDLTLFRAYDPEKGRWLSRDLIGEFGEVNLYSYVSNRTLVRIDRFGLSGTAIISVEPVGTGHANIAFVSDQTGATTTWGLYPYGVISPDLIGPNVSATRSRHIDDAEEAALKSYINGILDDSKEHPMYAPSYTCAGFAEGAWNLATGENLNSLNALGFSLPGVLADSINNANANDAKSMIGIPGRKIGFLP